MVNKIIKRVMSIIVSTMLIVNLSANVFAMESNFKTKPDFAISTTALQEEIKNKSVGDVIKINQSTGVVLSKQLIEETEDSSFEITLIKLNADSAIRTRSKTQTDLYVAIGNHTYTTGNYAAYLYGTFYYDSSSVEVATKAYGWSANSNIFRFYNYSESENFFTHSRTLKLNYGNLSGLGWKNYTISLTCTTAGNVSASGF